MAQVRDQIVLCNRTDCLFCTKMQESIPVERTRGPGFVPPWPIIFENRCDRSHVVIDKQGNCYSFSRQHPDMLRPAVIRAKGDPTYESLGVEPLKHPLLEERLCQIFDSHLAIRLRASITQEDIQNVMRLSYLMGREDERLGVKVET
jgi:hypothetical protein